jgi:putative Ig domain-containing protein
VLAITTATLPSGKVGHPYSATLVASGGVSPYNWTRIAGSLPAGLTLSSSGVISGTPTKNKTSDFTIRVTDSARPRGSATADLSITITK